MAGSKEPKTRKSRITDYSPDTHNANAHTEKGLKTLGDSLSEVGLARSIVVDKNGIILAGNLTQEVAVDQGFEDAIEVETHGEQMVVVKRMDLDLVNDDSHRARRLAYFDNRASELGLMWNPEQIKLDIDAGIDLNGIFDTVELKKMVNKLEGIAKERRPDHTLADHEELIQKWDVHEGDIWELESVEGTFSHRVMCGDSRTDLPRLMNGQKAQLVVTSPPYGVGKDYETGGLNEWRALMHDVFAQTMQFCNLHFVNLADRKTSPDSIYEAHTYGMLVEIMFELQMNLVGTRIWVKPPAWSQNPYWRNSYKGVDDFEYLGLFAKDKPKHSARLNENEMNDWGYRSTWSFISVMANVLHSAEFPVELPLRAIRLFSDVEDAVLDPFAGHGTTLAAAEQVGRQCYLMEKEPGYVAETLERFEDHAPRRVSGS